MGKCKYAYGCGEWRILHRIIGGSRVGKEPSRLAEPHERAKTSRAEPKILNSRAERARGLARSLPQRATQRAESRASGPLRSLARLAIFCNIHFGLNSI